MFLKISADFVKVDAVVRHQIHTQFS